MMLAAAFLAGLVLALALTPAGIRIAWAVGYLDHPAARKLHTTATPLLGGVVVFVAALGAWLGVSFALHRPAHSGGAYLFAGALVALLLGLWDDRFGMRPWVKLLGQAAAGGALLASGSVPDLGLPVVVEVAIALLAIVALMNAVNFLDNMNGMVGGLAALTLAAFAWTSASRGAVGLAAAQLALAGACAGFLPYNFPRARIFLGDAGSLLLGYSLGASALLAFGASPPGWGRAGPLLMLAYPAFDLVFVVVTRLREGRKIYAGGKDHTNHRLASVLRCPKTTVLLLWLSGAALCASGLVVLTLNRPLPTLLLSGLWTTFLVWAGTRLAMVPATPRPPANA
jgi:UDP-GlcNAc:undecaprenyl-phosphate GlcNAc-1-phosphate transferase